MSLQSWKKKFYPVTASKCPKNNLAMLKHVLLKYKGARRENTEKHGLFLSYNFLKDENEEHFQFSSGTCSLCKVYLTGFSTCRKCPIDEIGQSCDGSSESAYRFFVNYGDPEPMIELVESLIKEEQKKNRKKKRGKK